MEIERKFLIANNDWMSSIRQKHEIIQYYLSNADQAPTIRLRLKDKRAYLTLKYPSQSDSILVRDEYEYEIPAQDFHSQKEHAHGNIIQKTRYEVMDNENQLWEIDVFSSPNAGLVVAEIELQSPDQRIILPEWISDEVTANTAYSNIRMAFDAQSLVTIS